MKYPKDNRVKGKSNIEQVHLVLFRMLNILDSICHKHDIDYWLDYGSLLGAVRHEGFIPWDHEVDVGMLRADFEIFSNIACHDLPNDIFYQTKETDPFYIVHNLIEAKLRDKYSNYVEYSLKYPKHIWHNGIQVDIFVYDYDQNISREIGYTNSFERIVSNGKIHILESELEYLRELKFLNRTFPVPIGFDSYLKRNYGNYHKYPSKENQIPEHVDVFKPCNHSEILLWNSK